MTRTLTLDFVLPRDRAAISGGSLYNERLLAALARHGVACRVLDAPPKGAELAILDSVRLAELPELRARGSGSTRWFVLVHHFPSFVWGVERPARERRERALLEGATGFIVPSRSAAVQLEPLCEARPVLVVPPACAVDALGVPMRVRAPGFRGLLVANRIARKGVLAFFEAMAAQLTAKDRFEITNLGCDDFEPEYAAACHAFCAEHPLLRGRVHVLPVVASAAMAANYASHNVAISSSSCETYGMAMHEARVSGLPLLAVTAGEARTFVARPEHGELFSEVGSLALRCVALIRDPGALAALKDAAHRHPYLSAWSWDAAAASLLHQLAPWLR